LGSLLKPKVQSVQRVDHREGEGKVIILLKKLPPQMIRQDGRNFKKFSQFKVVMLIKTVKVGFDIQLTAQIK